MPTYLAATPVNISTHSGAHSGAYGGSYGYGGQIGNRDNPRDKPSDVDNPSDHDQTIAHILTCKQCAGVVESLKKTDEKFQQEQVSNDGVILLVWCSVALVITGIISITLRHS